MMTQSRTSSIFIFLCFAVAIISRSILFPDIPGGMNQDEAMSGYEAYALSLYGTDRFGTWLPAFFEGWGWTQLSVLQSYMSVPFIWIFGFSRFSARLPMLLVSIAGIYAVYAFTRNAFGRRAAIWVLFIAAISPWHFMQSRWGLDCNPFPHFLMFAIFFLHKGLTQKKIYVYVSMLFFGLAMYGYGISFFTVPPFLFLLALWLLTKRLLTFKEVLISILVYVIVALPILSVILVNFFHIEGGVQAPWFTAQFFPGNGRRGDLLLFTDKNVWLWLQESAHRLYGLIVLSWDDGPWNTTRVGSVYSWPSRYGDIPFSAPILAIGLIYMFLFKPKKEEGGDDTLRKASYIGKVLALSWLVLAIYASLMQQRPNINNINIIHYPVIIVLGMGVACIWQKIKLLACALVLAYAVSFGLFLQDYFTDHGKELSATFNAGLGEALQAAEASGADIIYSPEWDILTLFYLKIDPQYYQDKKTIVDKTGKELIPYGDRYRGYGYDGIPEFNENAAIVLHNNRLHHFDTDLYEIWEGEGFSALLPKK